MDRAHNLAEVDRLNIIFFGEMELTDAEKALRVVMAAALAKILLKYYDTILGISPFISGADGAELLASAAVGFAEEYRSFFEKYYPQYLGEVGGNGADNASGWAVRHSRELALWIAQTSINGDNTPLYDRLLNTVRTEVNEIGNLALLHAAFSSGRTKKRWKTFGDNRVRGTHREAAGQTVPLDQPFIVGNSRLMFPCDSSLGASPSEIVNCRCTIEYI